MHFVDAIYHLRGDIGRVLSITTQVCSHRTIQSRIIKIGLPILKESPWPELTWYDFLVDKDYLRCVVSGESTVMASTMSSSCNRIIEFRELAKSW
jgi:hypothetical protein